MEDTGCAAILVDKILAGVLPFFVFVVVFANETITQVDKGEAFSTDQHTPSAMTDDNFQHHSAREDAKTLM